MSELLVCLTPQSFRLSLSKKVTYHDACHLVHAQGVTAAPRYLLDQVRKLQVLPLKESDLCCGAGGTYNLTNPRISRELAQRKIRHILATGAHSCVMGNVGCAMHLSSEAKRMGVALEVVHPVSLLYEALQINGQVF